MVYLRRVAQWVFCALFLLLTATSAFAQATRTWVSGVGDDANPCSRTAPCKTFAGAISKTAAGGEIDVLDPGGFGTLTITKAITIDGGGGQIASVLASGVNGIIVQAGSADVVTLRNLRINGAGTVLGVNGVRVLSAGEVHIEKCVIQQFSNDAIDFQPTGGAVGYIADTTLIDNAGGGLVVNSGRVVVTNLHAEGNGNGVMVNGTAIATVRDSYAAGNGAGFGAVTGGAAINVENSVATHNQFGIYAALAAVARVSNSNISSNVNWGLFNDGTSVLISEQGNSIVANINNGTFNATITKQ